MPEKNTGELQGELKKAKDVTVFLQENENELQVKTLKEHLAALLEEKGMTLSEVVHASGIERTYAYHIFSGDKNPKRPKLLAIAFALGLTTEETQYLLRLAGLSPLYVRRPWDSVILHAIEHRQSIMETNGLLQSLGETQLLK